MSLGNQIESAFSKAKLPAGSLIHSPKVLLEYYGRKGSFEQGLANDRKFSREQKRLNRKLVSTRNKEPDLI